MNNEKRNIPTAKIENTQRINNITAKLAIGSESMTKIETKSFGNLSHILGTDMQNNQHLKTIMYMDK